MDVVHKQEFRVRDLATRSVTLFPTRAQVVRDIKAVALKVAPPTPPLGSMVLQCMPRQLD